MALKDTLKEVAPPVADDNKGAAYLMGGMSLIAGVLTAIGVGTDELENIWRNHPALSRIGISLILGAVAVGAIAAWALKKDSRWERILLIGGNIALAVGLILVTWGGLELASDSPAPTVTAKPVERSGQTFLEVEVKDSKLRADEGLRVSVEPLFEIEEKRPRRTVIRYRVGRPFYSASLAPSKDGNIEHSREVEIPPGNFQNVGVRVSAHSRPACYEESDAGGCLLVRIPQRNEEPQLGFKWKGRRGARALRVHVVALDIPNGSLRFRAMSLKPPKQALLQATLASNQHGDVERTFVLPVKRSRVVCVAASTAAEQLTCPPKDGQNPSWARLRVPRPRPR
jgi:hypothetical protein